MRDQWDTPRSNWPQHWTNGGTGITKFDSELRTLFETAIKESGRADLWLEGSELHSTSHKLSDFWEVFRRLQAERKAGRTGTEAQNEPQVTPAPRIEFTDGPDENEITPENYNGAEVFLR